MSKKGLLLFAGYMLTLTGLFLLFFNAYTYLFKKSEMIGTGGAGLFLCLTGALMISYARKSSVL